MVKKDKVNSVFRQTGGSCVLSSYAIVGNYFTGIPVQDFFAAYCGHYSLNFSGELDAERVYEPHFQKEWQVRNCKGYEVILDLHRGSSQPVFTRAREIFSGTFHLNSAAASNVIEEQLQNQEAFLNVAYQATQSAVHSVTVFKNEIGFWERDTNREGFVRIPSFNQFGALRDGVLYYRI